MTLSRSKAVAASETYFNHLRLIRASGGGTDERSYYTPLTNLLNAVGDSLRPKVFCVDELTEQGAGHPDLGLYAASQLQRRRPKQGQIPERGVVEVKPSHDDAWLTVETDQVSRYWDRYRLVLVTNTRDFVLLGEDSEGRPTKLETFQTAQSSEEFEELLRTPQAFANKVGVRLGEYLSRILSHQASLTEPRDLAWLLASYARDGLSRVEAAGEIPSLESLRSALENALGIRFEGERGAAFFRSTLMQTLFYGVFSAWVLWARDNPTNSESFNWRTASWHLRAPVIRALFFQLSNPGQLQPLGLVELMDWASAAFNRVDRRSFFERFEEGNAVPYFYEPFLEAFDPVLRKQLGVWYTPPEVVEYMVDRVDRALKVELGIDEGLAADNVFVLDPCCGTGAYLSQVLRRIHENLEKRNLGALIGEQVKQAALNRIFGFEIMPAPYVVAHLQVDLTLQSLGAHLDEDRAAIFLTNALTGWEPTEQRSLPFSELQEERDRAGQVKRDAPILVVLGNPPYNGFAGVAMAEERLLSIAYRGTKHVRKPEGQGLNDLYVRFFRMAERRIAEKTGQDVICFISNYSWIDGLSFTGMRELFLNEFDTIRIDNLNGDKYRTGKVTPDGQPDPSIFSTQSDPVGIQVGTAIATLVRKPEHVAAESIGYRNIWGQNKRDQLTASVHTESGPLYVDVVPNLRLGLPFSPVIVSDQWYDWPSLPELAPISFPGVTTSRDPFLVDIDLDRLKERIREYFDPDLRDGEVADRYPHVMRATARFDARSVRESLVRRGGPLEEEFVRYAYRPFDNRWLYWEAQTKLLDERRAEYKPHTQHGNIWISSAQHLRRGETEPQTFFTNHLASYHLIERGALWFPAWLYDDGFRLTSNGTNRRPNLSPDAQRYLEGNGATVEDLFYHVLAVLHDPGYRSANAGALRMEWPRIPIPGWPDGGQNAAQKFRHSAERGRKIAALLDTDTPVSGVTTGVLRSEFAMIAVPSTVDGKNMTGDDFNLESRWGHFGSNQAVMPGQGHVSERAFTAHETAELAECTVSLGNTTFDVSMNERVYWRNVPAAVWNYKLGGYQVLKKWLSYRERRVLGRPLKPEEVQHFTETARRIAGILKLTHRSS